MPISSPAAAKLCTCVLFWGEERVKVELTSRPNLSTTQEFPHNDRPLYVQTSVQPSVGRHAESV